MLTLACTVYTYQYMEMTSLAHLDDWVKVLVNLKNCCKFHNKLVTGCQNHVIIAQCSNLFAWFRTVVAHQLQVALQLCKPVTSCEF